MDFRLTRDRSLADLVAIDAADLLPFEYDERGLCVDGRLFRRESSGGGVGIINFR